MKKILLILLLLLLAGCAPAGTNDPSSVLPGSDENAKSIGLHVYRVYDVEAGVVCYFRSSGGVAMDCMPVSETKLGQ